MLANSFCHFPGIGPSEEQNLWDAGVHHHKQVLEVDNLPIAISLEAFKSHCHVSQQALEQGNSQYFMQHLPSQESWRMFEDFKDKVAYLDIETNGRRNDPDQVTTISIYTGKAFKTFVKDQNLEEFPKIIQKFKLLVTFNGKSFDLPVLRMRFGLSFDHAHIDLMHILRSLGYKGGLKSIEKQLGIHRPETPHELNGRDAIKLWRNFRRTKNPKALETLLAYNMEDVLNLERLMIFTWNQKQKILPSLIKNNLPRPKTYRNPFEPDHQLIEQILM